MNVNSETKTRERRRKTMAQPWKKKTCYWMKAMLLALWFSGIHVLADAAAAVSKEQNQLRFSKEGQFKILQVADMHFGDGKSTPCQDVLPNQMRGCSDLNTSAFIHRMIQAEKPHLIVFTGIFFHFLYHCVSYHLFGKLESRVNSHLPRIFPKTPKAL